MSLSRNILLEHCIWCLFLDVQFFAGKFTAALEKFAENEKEEMVGDFRGFVSLLLSLY